MEPRRVFRPVVVGLHHFGVEQDPDPHQSKLWDRIRFIIFSDPYYRQYGTRIFAGYHNGLSVLFSRKFDICRAGASCRGFDETEYQNGEHKTRYQCTIVYILIIYLPLTNTFPYIELLLIVHKLVPYLTHNKVQSAMYCKRAFFNRCLCV